MYIHIHRAIVPTEKGTKPMDIYTTVYMVFLFFALWGCFGAICYFGIKASLS